MKKLTIEEMREIARSRGGKCLSEKYVGAHIKIKWQCKKGHIWEAVPTDIKSGHWCPKCAIKFRADKQRGNIEDMRKLAKSRGGECLSEEYIGTYTKLKWQCKEGHTWKATPSNVKGGTWCPYCAGQYQTIEDMRKIAKFRGGKCLSEEYVGAHTKLKWQCGEGHIWEATPNNVKNKGTWCPSCAGVSRLTIKEMNEIARFRGGKCLSPKYINTDTKLKWQCREGHIWEAIPHSIKRGSWCPYCVGWHQTMGDMQKLAESRDGMCLSEKYINAKTKLKWQCKEGHIWEAVPYSIKRGTWCPKCSIKSGADKLRGNIEGMQKIAEARSGKCLSKEYVDNRTNLEWQCKEGHVWEATPSSIKGGTWCPYCSIYRREKICRGWFEAIFGEKFSKRRPPWLVNIETARGMELDGYNEELEIAFEYHGMQHFKSIFGESVLKGIQLRDERKRNLCKVNKVKLIEIPYDILPENMGECILEKCKEKGIEVNTNTDLSRIDFKKFDVYSTKHLEEMNEIAKKRGGKCLSDVYVDSHTKLKWACSKGHIWEAIPHSIKRGSWCPYCAGRHQTIEDMQKIAESRGGICLSEKYVDACTKLKWQCAVGHIWKATPNHIKGGKWCPYCAGKYQTIEDMQKLAENRGGKCLSKKYISATTKLKWRCAKNHKWETTPNNVKNKGNWCPYCRGSKKLFIQ